MERYLQGLDMYAEVITDGEPEPVMVDSDTLFTTPTGHVLHVEPGATEYKEVYKIVQLVPLCEPEGWGDKNCLQCTNARHCLRTRLTREQEQE